ncbi:MAG: hypothetical protein JWM26_2868 [Betaproteobacteria bacterium]|jgi:hypothetical protein|nr:hypothetical protein [Betaproteobacteria bacterium]
MSERLKITAKTVVLALVALNVLFFVYARISLDNRAGAASRIEDLQINPGRITLLNAATRGPGGQAPKSACLEWGPFGAIDAGRAEVALGRLALPRPALQRTVGESAGAKRYAYYVREPDAGTVAQIAELQRSFTGTEIKAGPCPS